MTKMLAEILEQPKILAGIEKENEVTLKKLVTELNEREIKHALFAGRGTSDHASIYGQYLFGIYKGVVSALAIPSCITLYDGKLELKDYLVIGVSQSGRAADAMAVLEQGNECGAVTVAITNDKESPMAKCAKYHLYCNANLEESVAATKTFTAQMYLIALLTAYWSNNTLLLANLRKLPTFAEEMLKNCQNDIEKHVERFRFMKEGFVLSRGITYSVALEAALKIQETCYIKMKGYAISDFYHGPLAQLDSDVPVIILAPKGKISEDIKAISEKIEEIGIQPLIVTDDIWLNKNSENAVLLPYTGCEATQTFLFAIFAQRFAEYLSVSKGLNPDSPRLLKKVTITK
jgi:glucosamine--fructose-6-phosphate aminotransferase (isomerizing)